MTNDLTSDLGRHWTLDPAVTFLNHGSFGACPAVVLEAQARLRADMERQPVRFFVRTLPDLLDAAREALAAFVGANAAGLAFVPNATTGVNTVLRSLDLLPGDELLVTDHAYNACRNALEFVAARAGARVVTAAVPFPIDSAEGVVEAVLSAVSRRTRVALLDHVTSPTGLVWPMDVLVRELSARGVDSLVDGAHAPGMLPLDVAGLGAAWYTGNCHKWLCAPKGAAFLWVREDKRATLRPLVVSHGANLPADRRSRFHLEMDWTGTDDPTPFLCVPEAIRVLGGLLPGGWPALMERNRRLALSARRLLTDALEVMPPCPDAMVGSLAAVPLPPGALAAGASKLAVDPLQVALMDRFGIEVPVMAWPAPPDRVVRVAAQAYNRIGQYERLAEALRELVWRG